MSKIKIIAEIGANHNGDMTLAKEMIHAASENGADYAKFQSWQADKIGPGPWDSPEPFFQFKNKREFYNNAQLTNDNHFELIETCNKLNIRFLTTCFNIDRSDFLGTLGMDTIKIASCDSSSTGMTTTSEFTGLIDQLENIGKKYAVLHCVSMYPTPIESINMNRFNFIKSGIGQSGEFGISDHSLGSFFPKVAVSLGATWIEKHFTTDKSIPGPDNFMSIDPDELLDIRKFCEDFEKLGFEETVESNIKEMDLRKIIDNRFGDNT